jgi:hypothetical protein
MSDENELDPRIEVLLRDVPPADSSIKESHIAAALGEITTPAASKGRLRFFSAAAAVVVLAAGGIAISRSSNDAPPAIAADTSTTTIAKAAGDCGEEWSGLWGDSSARGDFSWAETDYAAIGHQGWLSVYLAMEPCTKVGDIDYWGAMNARDKEGSASQQNAACSFVVPPVAEFTDRGNGNLYTFVLVKTETGVSLSFKDRCNEPLGSITLPTSGD